MSENRSISGLNDAEAQEFHAFYVQGLVGFVAIAVIAHMSKLVLWCMYPSLETLLDLIIYQRQVFRIPRKTSPLSQRRIASLVMLQMELVSSI